MWNGVLCGLLAGAMWGMVFIVPELLAAFSPVELAVGRYIAYGAIATGLMLPRLRGLLNRLDRSDCGALVRHALAGNIVYYMLLALGVKLAGVAPTSLIIGLLPITVTLLGRKDHGAIPLSQLALPLLVVAAGIACINVDVFLHARASGASQGATLLGVLCAFGALLCWSWYALDNARFLKRNAHFSSAEWSALYGMASGLIALAVGALAFAIWHGDVTGAAGVASGRNWTAFWITNTLLALGASVIGNHLWNIASRRVPVTLSGQLILFETLFALLYGFVYHRQFPRVLEMAAIGLLVAGVVWAVRMHAVQPVAEQTAVHG
ncbi:DMT family transporter [Massilia antarctica]|uniref:DMT family transporter n=1 Tax=Massilia antarctica TaxID=2765360 RepID=UPI0006BB62FC|nr:DMT family transporter [Massilia sp. H27-R4]MCY0914326.1 DMT family transporter [Massilia sp. H27-R4]CUI08741.1 FIG006442: Integral membrane protein [Janthinobacterium sp. CG23_2]CUU32527.1 FIG006442: Integral membrane protein [Janthinobacterium sp. CG23_2]